MNDNRYFAAQYRVFSGVSLVYYTSHTQHGALIRPEGASFAIFHCREGRMECTIGQELCYISPGDLLIVRTALLRGELFFPLRHYHGITACIDVAAAPHCLSCVLEDVAVQPGRIEEKFCGAKGYFIARSNPSFEHIFSELYAVPEEVRRGYCRIKLLELMLFLSVYPVQEEQQRAVSPAQAGLAKEAAAYLTQHMEERVTVRQMAAMLHVSDTVIKSAFRAVYGVSFYAYLKTQKMESAAWMLEYTEQTVAQIAGAHGYDNASKFAVAFRSVKGMAPQEYRQKNARPAR